MSESAPRFKRTYLDFLWLCNIVKCWINLIVIYLFILFDLLYIAILKNTVYKFVVIWKKLFPHRDLNKLKVEFPLIVLGILSIIN